MATTASERQIWTRCCGLRPGLVASTLFGIRFPGNHPANGKVFDTPAAHIDLVPTLLELVDLPIPEDLDGRSLLPLLEDKEGAGVSRMIYAFKQGYDFSLWPGSMRNGHTLYVRRSQTEHELYD